MDDWRYSPERMELRTEVLMVLLSKYGTNDRLNGPIYECAHDWVSSGKKNTDGLIEYYEQQYNAES